MAKSKMQCREIQIWYSKQGFEKERQGCNQKSTGKMRDGAQVWHWRARGFKSPNNGQLKNVYLDLDKLWFTGNNKNKDKISIM